MAFQSYAKTNHEYEREVIMAECDRETDTQTDREKLESLKDCTCMV